MREGEHKRGRELRREGGGREEGREGGGREEGGRKGEREGGRNGRGGLLPD